MSWSEVYNLAMLLSSATGSVEPEGLERNERELLLEGIWRRYGYDYRQYAPASLNRRLDKVMANEGLPSCSALLERLLHDPACMHRLIDTLAIHVTAMFRNPAMFLGLRDQVVPLLRTYPYIRVWVAGCSSGEEAYSIAILLQEAGLYDRCRIYATDLSTSVVKRAARGVFSLTTMRDYTRNYQAAGGECDFSNYYTAAYGRAIFKPSLKKNITFARHNLATDGSFNDFHLLLCRNVMIYFNNELQQRVFKLLHSSMVRLGVLALGRRESLHFSQYADCYQELGAGLRLFRRTT